MINNTNDEIKKLREYLETLDKRTQKDEVAAANDRLN
jgi:hypothetical protein